MFSRMTSLWAALVTLVLIPTSGLASSVLGGRTPLGRIAQRPANQTGLDNTASWLDSPFFTFPANATNVVELDYAVESEESYDFLEVYWVSSGNVATLLWKESGMKAGHKALSLPSAGGLMKLRFRYAKDVSLTRHLDTAWVDNVEVKSSGVGGPRALYAFNTWGSGLPAGWSTSSSGFAGAWSVTQELPPVSVGRPVSQAGQANTASYLERTVNFPAATNNYVSFDYFVDSQPGSDRLRVYLDPAVNPTPVWSVSGLNQAGHALINKINNAAIPSGNHVLRFEYTKGAGPSAGLDTARVDNVTVGSGGSVVEVHTFSGRNLGVAPVQVASRPAEWTSGGSNGGWVAFPALPHKSYVPLQTPGQALLPSWGAFNEPLVDGRMTKQDYRNPSFIKVRNDGDPTQPLGQLSLVSSSSSNMLYVGMHVKGASASAGNESGQLTVYLDADHAQTLRGLSGCGTYGQLPSWNDRKLNIGYSIAAGGATATTTVTQQKGTCAAWSNLTSTDTPWPVSVGISEPSNDLGSLHLELRIGLPASVISDQRLGFAIKRADTWGAIPLAERLPYADVAGTPADGDIYTWETVNLSYVPGTAERGGNGADGCCFPTPDQPGLQW